MQVKIQKWGNSQGIRIPKSILDAAHMSATNDITLKVQEGKIILEATSVHKTLKERFKNYKGDYKSTEWQTGSPRGREEF